MERVLVTGGAGFIGSHTVDLLLQKGYQVRVMDSLQPRVHPKGWPDYLPPQIERLKGDVQNPEDWRNALKGIDRVFHLAAYQDYMTDFSTFFKVNTVSTALLYEIIVADRLPVKKVVLASSQAVYGEGKYADADGALVYPDSRPAQQLEKGRWDILCPRSGRPLEHRPITEDRVNPHTAYGISKYALEQASFSLGRKYGIPTVNMRYSIVQGRRNSFYNAYSGICRIFTLRLLHDQPAICYEDGRSLRDYVYVGDVARANVLVMEEEKANFCAFNVGGQKATTVEEYARLVAKICGKAIEPRITGEYRFGDTRHTVSSSAALETLGWRPQTGLEEIIAEYVEWVKAQPDIEDFYAKSQEKMRAANVIRKAAP